jgi:hypothetical protein
VQASSGFLILIALFVICLLLYFQGAKNRAQPTRLKMKAEGVAAGQPFEADLAKARSSQTIPLNVMFNYNGHSFDAYETLGVPAGSSWEDIRNSFEQNLASSDETSREFYLAAFNAIKSRQQF